MPFAQPVNILIHSTILAIFCMFPFLAEARSEAAALLPHADHADTEVSTNFPFRAVLDSAGRFAFALSCRTTPSNNVEVAFGTDANANGVLDLEETERVVGWDCGTWFTRRNADGACERVTTGTTNGIQTLSWHVQAGVNGTPSRLSATAEGAEIFTGIPLDSTYDRSWDTVRLTSRGLDATLENFTVSVTPDGTAIIMR